MSIQSPKMDAQSLGQFASPYVRHAVTHIPKSDANILDFPCGFGRNAHFLASLGHCVAGADIDERKVLQAAKSWSDTKLSIGQFFPVVANADHELPFRTEVFDFILIVHFASNRIIELVSPLLKRGGVLLYETFGTQGENWRTLPPPNRTKSRLEQYEILDLQERLAQRSHEAAVAVKALARKK